MKTTSFKIGLLTFLGLCISTTHVRALDCLNPVAGSVIVSPKDYDGDKFLNEKDNCPTITNKDQLDSNKDGVGDACDIDGDGVPDQCDNCKNLANPDQLDTDNNGQGNSCDTSLNIKISQKKEKSLKTSTETKKTNLKPQTKIKATAEKNDYSEFQD